MNEPLPGNSISRHISQVPDPSSLEKDFPSATLSSVGLQESWRKEVHRPATSTHKWWAKRLGTVFRGIITSAVAESATDALDLYSSKTSLDPLVVLDPFGGSGITCVEALKLGALAVSFDINPVATLVQRQAVQRWDSSLLQKAFCAVETACRAEIDRVHRTEDGKTVLYYFWVAIAACPTCAKPVRLFDSPVFSKNAYPKRVPKAQLVCPQCLDVQENRYDFESATCANGHIFTPDGAVNRTSMTCPEGHVSKVLSALSDGPPDFEMYAKMVIDARGKKSYCHITAWDRSLYSECEALLKKASHDAVLPVGKLASGNNTSQAIKWNFREWKDFFNARQLYCLSLLATAIRDVEALAAEREALCALFSGTLEFNNLFTSFKGEGTGAVRHMFSHHILKPERTPLEAHPWGTPYSSGSFSTLMKSRLLRAHEYKRNPVDLIIQDGVVSRKTGISNSLESTISDTWVDFVNSDNSRAYIATRNSAQTDLPNESIDLVITDPPYMDNVHYAELADFFHAWLQQMHPYEGYSQLDTTRATGEVQHADAVEFGKAIQAVWTECARVLKASGVIAFTFHQARIDGWVELVNSLVNAGLVITAIQPVKGEMATSIVKAGAREPSNLDSIVVCRKAQNRGQVIYRDLEDAFIHAQETLRSLINDGVAVGPGDVRSVIRGTLLAYLAPGTDNLAAHAGSIDAMADRAIASLLA